MKKLFLTFFVIAFSTSIYAQVDKENAKRCYKFCMGERDDREFCRKVCYEEIDPREPAKEASKPKTEPASAPKPPTNK